MRKNKQFSLLYEMAVFAEVVERGSFTAAAQSLGSSTSSVSRSVTKLEDALNTHLLQRSTRKLSLTSSGEEVYTRCRQMVETSDLVLETCDTLNQDISGDICVSVPKALGSTVLHPLMPDFLAQYPLVNVQMILDDRALDLIDNRIDLALRITDQPPQGMLGKELFRLDHMLCVSPEYIEQHGMPEHPAELRQHSCIYLGNNPADSRWRLKKDNEVVDIDVTGRYAANHTRVRLDAVRRGLGIATLPTFTAAPDLRSGRLIRLFEDWQFITNYQGAVWVLYTATRHLPQRQRVFVEYLREHLSGIDFFEDQLPICSSLE